MVAEERDPKRPRLAAPSPPPLDEANPESVARAAADGLPAADSSSRINAAILLEDYRRRTHVVPADLPVCRLGAVAAWDSLTEREKKFAHHFSMAAWAGSRICPVQVSKVKHVADGNNVSFARRDKQSLPCHSQVVHHEAACGLLLLSTML